MKKLLLSLALPCLGPVTFAQIDKGNTLLGGNLSINFQQANGNSSGNSSNTNIQPYIQFACKANRTIGFGLGFNYQSSKNAVDDSKSRQFSLSPSISFTQFHPIKGNFGWWLEERVGAGFYQSKITGSSGDSKSNYTSIFGNITPGVYYMAGDKKQWLLHASVGGVGGWYNDSNGGENWGINTNLFQYYQLGFAYIFRKG